ncbi:multidrug efflux MFS transporter [Weissella coleopterorum]|uniref:Multidrug efflux MFS transporter n=1 Tax=Weissella coleopterorum TaxID=2714949 RepID=A0A6G8AZI8_9LACO|nr:MDR family MFS transporter [Weissella coleopterorum]QIL50379.1 multidrug efflux MFS transporter [Weissella coleopterorum]
MATDQKKALDIHGKPYSRVALVIIILFATFAGMLNQTSLGTAIPTLMKDFDISMATAQQATTWFLLVNGIMIPVSAFLMTRFRTKWLYEVAYILLFAGMLLAALTPAKSAYWPMFIAGRALQALSVGITMPLMQLVMVNIFPEKQRGIAMGLGGLVIGMAPAIGPTLSGWILEKDHVILGLTLNDSWRSIFVFPMIVLGISIILGFFLLKDVIPNRAGKLEWFSLVLSTIGFGSFLWGFTNVATDGWGDLINVILPIILGIIFILLFGYRQLKLDRPFLNVRVFKNKQFTITTILVALAMMAMMGVEMMLPLYMQNVHGLSPLDSGLALLPGALMMGLMSPIAGIAYDKVGAKRLSRVGFAILTIATFPFMFLGIDTPIHYVTVLYALRMFGIAMVMMPLTASAMSALPVKDAADGTAANNTARQVASAVVVALLTSVTQNIINNNTPAHHVLTENPIQYASKMANASLDGFHVSFGIGMLFAVMGLIVANFLAGKHENKDVDVDYTKGVK